ncbi:TPA: hypothetical protein DEP96_00300 [Candidatus Uhrbacteria bacterium]|nr:hypothetical protein [Candidatus Uhrbacteria bacterium]
MTAGHAIPNPQYKKLILEADEALLLAFAADHAMNTMKTSQTKLMDFLCQVAEFRPLVALTAIEPRAPSYKRLDDWQRQQVLFNAASFHPLAVLRALRSQPAILELDATQRLAARQVAMQHLGSGVRIDEEPKIDLTDMMLVIDSRLARKSTTTS